MARVGLIFGGRSVEHQVSLRSARTVYEGLAAAGHTPVPLAIAEDGCWLSAEESAAILKSDAAAVEPLGGELDRGQRVLDLMGDAPRHVGPGRLALIEQLAGDVLEGDHVLARGRDRVRHRRREQPRGGRAEDAEE